MLFYTGAEYLFGNKTLTQTDNMKLLKNFNKFIQECKLFLCKIDA